MRDMLRATANADGEGSDATLIRQSAERDGYDDMRVRRR